MLCSIRGRFILASRCEKSTGLTSSAHPCDPRVLSSKSSAVTLGNLLTLSLCRQGESHRAAACQCICSMQALVELRRLTEAWLALGGEPVSFRPPRGTGAGPGWLYELLLEHLSMLVAVSNFPGIAKDTAKSEPTCHPWSQHFPGVTPKPGY